MELVLERKYKKPDYIIGKLSEKRKVESEKSNSPTETDTEEFVYLCDTLEPPVGTPKEMRTAGSKKCIPPGTYKIRMVWSPKFKMQLPQIDVLSPLGETERGSILIHAGNTVKDTSGCILVGRNLQTGKVLESRKTLNMILALIKTAIKKEQVTITIRA